MNYQGVSTVKVYELSGGSHHTNKELTRNVLR